VGTPARTPAVPTALHGELGDDLVGQHAHLGINSIVTLQ
jgi:hypothetical protein